MPEIILALFSVVLCLGVFAVVAIGMREVILFRWGKARGLLRFSVATLLGITSSIALALGIYRFQNESPVYAREFSFPAILAICFGMCAVAFAIAHDYCRRQSGSALESFRQRHRNKARLFTDHEDEVEAVSKPRTRKKWWLRRHPNRFRSISHRDTQISDPSGYYIRDD